MQRLIYDVDGNVAPVLANLTLMLTEMPEWKGVFAHDEFNARVIITKRAPWGRERSNTFLTDRHESQVRIWFQKQHINPAIGDVGRAIQAAAHHNPVHPVRDYFERLQWDGVARLDNWLHTYFHAEDTEYVRAVASRYLISAVARVYQPGCKVDHVLVLEGPQGKQKSVALRTLAIRDEWFTDRLSHLSSKDTIIEIAGNLLIELAEMDALMRAASSTAKSFLTRTHDKFRPPYGKHLISHPRQCVFAATINPPAGGYLKDPTGARRFWPVTCHGMIDRDGLEVVRDQLWAEAVHRYKGGAKWWLETPELEALAEAEQNARFEVDEWEDPVKAWLKDRTEVSGVAEILQHCLGLAPEHHSMKAQKRVGAILTRLNFKQVRPKRDGERVRCYQREA
jgi:predicted P-loop ATPase